MKDTFGRTIDYMRISITDRCNLRCRYCMPEDGIEKVSMSQILTYEEILRICRAAAGLGITKLKVTGGEPLVRKGCPSLVHDLKQIPGIEQVTLTTNGQLLEQHMDALLDAGLDGVNISLDSLRADRYNWITGGGDLDAALRGIEAAQAAAEASVSADTAAQAAAGSAGGFRVKINCLLQTGFNEDELPDFADLAFSRGLDVRFIEIMPIGFGRPDTGLSNVEVLRQLRALYPDLQEDPTVHGNGPAVYYRRPGQAGAIGLISAMHRIFCGNCNRIRLTSQGFIKPCLCYEDSIDLRSILRAGRDRDLTEALRQAIGSKPSGHCFDAFPEAVEPKAMMQIGG